MPFHRLVAPLDAAFDPSRQPFAVAAIDGVGHVAIVTVLKPRTWAWKVRVSPDSSIA